MITNNPFKCIDWPYIEILKFICVEAFADHNSNAAQIIGLGSHKLKYCGMRRKYWFPAILYKVLNIEFKSLHRFHWHFWRIVFKHNLVFISLEKEQSFLVWMSYIFFYTSSFLITLWRQIGQIPPQFRICSSHLKKEILAPSYCFIHISLKIKILESLLQLERPSEVSQIGHDLLFFMGFLVFGSNLVNVSVHFCTCISAWID